jgi:hypothetical protein
MLRCRPKHRNGQSASVDKSPALRRVVVEGGPGPAGSIAENKTEASPASDVSGQMDLSNPVIHRNTPNSKSPLTQLATFMQVPRVAD